MKKMLLVYRSLETFVKDEIAILSKQYDLEPFHLKNIFSFIKLFFAIKRNDLVYIYFEHRHAAISVFFCKLLNKKSIIHAGAAVVLNHGWEDYKKIGLKRDFTRKLLPICAVKNADLILPVSNYKKTGLLKHVKPKKMIVVENGIDHKRFTPGNKKRQNKVICISMIDDFCLERKGLLYLISVAKKMPRVKFKIIGKVFNKNIFTSLKKRAPKNLVLTGAVSHEKLLHELQTAKVYIQPSLYESFGVALAEAMLCECVPVVANSGSLPEVVGNVGYKVPYGNVNDAIAAINLAMKSKSGKKARERILKNYTLDIRAKKLAEAIKNV